MDISRRRLVGAGATFAGLSAALVIAPQAKALLAPPPAAPLPPAPYGPPAPAVGQTPLVSEALAELDRHGARIPRRDRIAVVDFSRPSSEPRMHLVDVASGRIERSFLVAHGSGSDPARTGMLQRFSNVPGSNASSRGAFLTAGRYVGKHGASQRLIGLDPDNDMALSRDIYFRTSETCDLSHAIPEVGRLDALLSAFSGIDPAYDEPLQGQRYAVGQEFKGHTDYFEPNGADFDKFCAVAGNRTWTFMIYLNRPQAGGATRFKVIDKTVQPETGKLLGWNNRRPDGSLNPATLHHGMKVRKGVKYVITKWYRERPWG